MSRQKKDNVTPNLFDKENGFYPEVKSANTCQNNNVVSFSEFSNKRKETETENNRNSIIESFLNHAKKLNW